MPPAACASALSSSSPDLGGDDPGSIQLDPTGTATDKRRESRMLERLATADGLAEWVLLEEDGGLGIGGYGVEGTETGRDPMDVDDGSSGDSGGSGVFAGEGKGKGKQKGAARKLKVCQYSTFVSMYEAVFSFSCCCLKA